MQNRKAEYRNPDWLIVFIYLILVVFGWLNIYSTQSDTTELFDFSKKHGAQFMWMLIAFFSAIVVMLINSRFYSVFSYHIYIFVMLLLVATLVIGVEIKNSKSWIDLGLMRFQPSELAKLATSLALAKLLGSYEFKLDNFRNWFKAAAIIFTPVALILLQKDWGSALVFSCFLLVLYRQGMSGWILVFIAFAIALFIFSLLFPMIWIVAVIVLITICIALYTYKPFYSIILKFVGLGVAFLLAGVLVKNAMDINVSYDIILSASALGAIIVCIIYSLFKRYKIKFYTTLFFLCSIAWLYSTDYVYDNILKHHHRDRIEVMLGIKQDIKDVGYNVYQSKVAIGSGGFIGKGFLQGTQTKLQFVPEQSTDFIFCTIGEEWGFVGSFIVIFLYALLLVRLIYLAERQKTIFSRVYGYCVASILFFHLAINVGMTIGLAPVIGIPLPFMSAGGSSLWSFTMLLFIFLKLDSTDRVNIRK